MWIHFFLFDFVVPVPFLFSICLDLSHYTLSFLAKTEISKWNSKKILLWHFVSSYCFLALVFFWCHPVTTYMKRISAFLRKMHPFLLKKFRRYVFICFVGGFFIVLLGYWLLIMTTDFLFACFVCNKLHTKRRRQPYTILNI